MQDFSLYPIFPFEWLIKNIAHQKMTNKSDDYPKVKKFLSEKSILPKFTHSRKIQNKSFFSIFSKRNEVFEFSTDHNKDVQSYSWHQRCTFSLTWNPKTIGFGIDFIKEKRIFLMKFSARESGYHFRENLTTRDPLTEWKFLKNWKRRYNRTFIFR